MIDYELETAIQCYNRSRLIAFLNYENFEHVKKFDKILNARYSKTSRIKKKLVYLLSHTKYHFFVTFTFDDTYINKTDRSKRDLIKNVLNDFDNNILYILNVDYGKKNDREHYHCIVGTDVPTDFNNYLKLYYPFFSLALPIRLTGSDIKKVSKYINKLTNHCCKDTTRNKRIVYNFKGYDEITNADDRFKLFILQSHKLGL